MKRKSAFRPTLTDLESRQLLTVGPYTKPFNNVLQAEYVLEANSKVNDVVFVGDSITLLWAYTPTQTDNVFLKEFGKFTAVPFGIGGDTTDNLLYRIGGGDLNGKPKVVVLLVGINNLLLGQTPKQTAEGITSVVDEVHKVTPKSKVLLLGLLPSVYPADSALGFVNAEVPKVNTLISKLGTRSYVTYRNVGVVLQDGDGTVKPGLIGDSYVHPTAAGYEAISTPLKPIIADLLKPGFPKGHVPLIPVPAKIKAHATVVVVPKVKAAVAVPLVKASHKPASS